jgi:hypothetical protein
VECVTDHRAEGWARESVSCPLAVITAAAGYRKWLLDARFLGWRALLALLMMEDGDFADSVRFCRKPSYYAVSLS